MMLGVFVVGGFDGVGVGVVDLCGWFIWLVLVLVWLVEGWFVYGVGEGW